MKPIGACIFVVYFLMIFPSPVRFYVFVMPPGGSKMLAVNVSIVPYQWLGRSPSYHEVLTPVQLLPRLQNHHHHSHHTQVATTTTPQTSLAMDQKEKKQVQSIRDQLKGHSLPDGSEIVGFINSSSSEFTFTRAVGLYESNLRQYESGSAISERKTTRETADRKGITFVSVCILLAIYLLCSKAKEPELIARAIRKEPEKPKPPPRRGQIKGKGIDSCFTLENLQQYFGHKRKDVAASLGVSVSTFKRMCRQQGIPRWQNQMGSSGTGSVSKPDQHGERNPPSTCKTLSTNGQTEMENEMVGHLVEMSEFLLDFDDGPNVSSVYNENEEAGASSEWASQLRNLWTVSTAHPNSSGLVVPHPHMASQILGETMGSLEEWGNSFASLEEPHLPSHNSGSMSTVPPCSYPVPSQPMPTIPHTLGSLEDRRNSLAFLEDVFPEEHVSGSLLASVEDVSLEEHVHTMGSSDDLRNLLASAEEHHFSAGHVFRFINQIVPSCFDPAPSQSMPNTLHTMPPIPHMMSLLAQRQDTRSVMLKATYGDIAIKFQLPLTCGIGKLKEEVSKRLECEPGSYHVEYKDEDGTWITINCDEDVRIFLLLFTSLGNQVVKLRVRDKVPNTTKFCQCGHAADH